LLHFRLQPSIKVQKTPRQRYVRQRGIDGRNHDRQIALSLRNLFKNKTWLDASYRRGLANKVPRKPGVALEEHPKGSGPVELFRSNNSVRPPQSATLLKIIVNLAIRDYSWEHLPSGPSGRCSGLCQGPDYLSGPRLSDFAPIRLRLTFPM
jgi:hypothetical protein